MDRQAVLEVHVQPGARETAIQGLRDDTLWVKIKAPPVKGQANAALLKFMAHTLGIPESALALARGYASRHKRLIIRGMDNDELKARLAQVSDGTTSQGRENRG
ncbi:MAG: DUF167 domain-containing protein [Chloroflexota bacterium]